MSLAKIVNWAQFAVEHFNFLKRSYTHKLCTFFRHALSIIAYVTISKSFSIPIRHSFVSHHPFRTLFYQTRERDWDFLIACVLRCRVWRWHIVPTRCGWQFEINFLSLNRIRIQFACVCLYMYVRMQYVPKSIFSLCIYRILFPFDCVAPFHSYDMCSIARVNYLKCRTHIRHFN